MKVTVVVRTYNRPLFLKEALASIHLQTHKDWEVLIFDDGGLSETFEIYKDFKNQNKDKRILFFSSNEPYYYFKKSWTTAPKLAEGEIMVRLDDDDILEKDTLEFLSNTYTQHKDLDFSYGSTIFFEGDELKNKVIEEIKKIYDPEIPVNIYELGLIYKIEISDEKKVNIEMTLTSPNCPVAESLPKMVKDNVLKIEEVSDVDLKLVWSPPWTKDMMSEAAKLELNL